ncbi:MAG: anthranilate phosphoribosyltransferase [Actinomycetota bacterium]
MASLTDRRDADFWPSVLARVSGGASLSADEAAESMRAIMEGDATPAQVGGLLMALRTKGESVEEIAGFADVMLEFASPVTPPDPLPGLVVVDTCGTGGDRSGTFNISTVGAIVAAGAGATVAKHGNRAATSDCGSADLLEALGVRVDLDAAGVQRCLTEAGIGFMFAPAFHPATAYAVGIRRELRVPTAFNFLGPLTNPARPGAQVVGVSDARMLPLVAEVLARRGVRAKVFRGEDGLDELTTTGLSTVYEVVDGNLHERTLDPTDLGFAKASPEALLGGDVDRNVEIAREVLAGAPGPTRDVVMLNAGAALEVAGVAASLADGIVVAAASVDEGRASAVLDRWVACSAAATSANG